MTARHTTLKGRVVYNRAPHYFNLKDVVRVTNRMRPPADLAEALSAFPAIFGISLQLLQYAFDLTPYPDRWGTFFTIVRDAIAQLWTKFTSQSQVPKEAQGSVKLEGGLSLL